MACKGFSPFLPPFVRCFSKAQHTVAAAVVADALAIPSIPAGFPSSPSAQDEQDSTNLLPCFIADSAIKPKRGLQTPGYADTPEWKMLDSRNLGLSISMIDKPTRTVLKNLRKTGYEAYLVGGCVRDLLLRKIPKDFDVITTADLREIRKNFSRCMIVGRRFPICHVYIQESIVEVSSFSTSERKGKNHFMHFSKMPRFCDDRDYARWTNCIKRDFTINGLMYDPYENVVYDYIGGIEDLEVGKVRTVIPAHTSFEEDCARILRAIRIAARLNFQFNRDTARAIQDFSHSILRLDKARLMMEMNYMLAFGAAEASLRLLWRFGLLEILLPLQAAYLVSQGFRRRDKHSNMLLVLFAKLDELLAPNQPCHSSLWVSLLAFHLALANEPQDALVITAFVLSVRNGGNLRKAVSKSRKIFQEAKKFSPEVLDAMESESDDMVMKEILNLALSVKSSLSAMMDEHAVSQAMSMYPQAPFSNLVFITITTYSKVWSMFDCLRGHNANKNVSKRGININYESLVNGDVEELRFVFAKVVIDSLYSFNEQKDQEPS